MSPNPRALRKAKHQATREARREAKRVVEAQFDFSNAGQALGQAGAAVRNALDDISSSWDNSNDPDLLPSDDESAIRMRVEQQFNKRKEFFGHLIAYCLVMPVLWVVFGLTGPIFGLPWPLIVMLGWGAGLAAHAVETFYTTGRRARRQLNTIHDAFYSAYGDEWPKADRKELRRIRGRAVQLINKRREFFQHLAVYALINTMLWIIYGTSSSLPLIGDIVGSIPFPWPLIVMFGWGIGLVYNGFEALSAGSRENAVQREIERERDRLDAGEKPKRERRPDNSASVRLTEDGELTDSMVEEINNEEKPKRSAR